MENFFKKPKSFLKELEKLSGDSLVYRVMPHFLMEIVKKYFRLEIIGIENVPKSGRCLIVPNHSGFSGFDALVLAHELYNGTKRVPRILMHHLWFLSEFTSVPAHKLGFVEATFDNGVKHLKRDELVAIFPEGEHGNFKPSTKMYRLQPFKTGFVRMALETKSPIVPVVVIGAEETHINLTKLELTQYLKGLVLPLPLNIIPLPAKWRIVFLKPRYLPFKRESVQDKELVQDLTNDIREEMQKALSREVGKRGTAFI